MKVFKDNIFLNKFTRFYIALFVIVFAMTNSLPASAFGFWNKDKKESEINVESIDVLDSVEKKPVQKDAEQLSIEEILERENADEFDIQPTVMPEVKQMQTFELPPFEQSVIEDASLRQNIYASDIDENKVVEEKKVSSEKRIRDVVVFGSDIVNPDLIIEKMTLKVGDVYNRDLLQENLKAIYDLGFFTERMKVIPANNQDGSVTLKVIVEENAPVTDFTIEGNTVLPLEEILVYLMPMVGKPQNISVINQAIAEIQHAYAAKSYILARIDSIDDDPDGTLNLTIKEGHINQVLISGNEKTKNYVIERNVLIEPGSIYNENFLKEDLVRLYATQAFKDVTREIEPVSEELDLYDITINVEEQRTANVSLGGGIDSVTGFFGSVGIADNNFRGRNQRLALNTIVGTGVMLTDASVLNHMNLQAELSFFEPYFYNSDTSLMNKIFYRDFGSYQVPLAIERRIGIESTVAHRMKHNKHMTATFSVGLENINVSEGDADQITSLYEAYNIPISERANQLEGGTFLSLSPAIIYDTRDNTAIPRNGTLLNLRFDEQIGVLDFDKTHGKLIGMIKQYIPVGKKSSLSFTGKAGGAVHGSDLPEVMAYRLGGPYTIRGFKMSGVGTGESFVMGSVELATPIPFLDRTKISFLNNLRFTTWVDAGQIYDSPVTDIIYDRPGYAISAGVGLKLFVPGMGPVSIDYGIPLTNPGSNSSSNGYFTFGVGDLLY
ncbi:MAG: BamA/TamA family outer membrane protein [Candidatus Gastranaerophilales bacterium]